MTLLLGVKNISKVYNQNRKSVPFFAVKNLSFSLEKRQILGLVGESGCGKSTLARLLLGLLPLSSGQIIFDGQDISTLTPAQLRALRSHMQMVFQDPWGSLNPFWTIGQTLREPFVIHRPSLSKTEINTQIEELLLAVGLDSSVLSRYPQEFSGGQRQRVCIARAMALRPQFLILDEPVSALDVSIQGQILNVLYHLHEKFGVSYLFISHDIELVAQFCSKVMVMFQGSLVEQGTALDVLKHPHHVYTQQLVNSVVSLFPHQSPR